MWLRYKLILAIRLDLFGSWEKIACELNVCEAGGDEPNALIRTVFGLDFPHESSRKKQWRS